MHKQPAKVEKSGRSTSYSSVVGAPSPTEPHVESDDGVLYNKHGRQIIDEIVTACVRFVWHAGSTAIAVAAAHADRFACSAISRCHRRLPLFLAGLFESWINSPTQPMDSAYADDDDWLAGSTISESLAGVIQVKLARLSEVQRRLLEGAAILSGAFSLQVLAAVVEQPILDVGGHCDELVRRQMWLRTTTDEFMTDGSRLTRYSFRQRVAVHAGTTSK